VKFEIDPQNKNGITNVALQKNPSNGYRLHGTRGFEKARLYHSIESGKIKMGKVKHGMSSKIDPYGLE
jgi:hypothetical protein